MEDERVEFVKALAAALAPLGQTSSELAGQLADCSDSLGLVANFLVLPTAVQFTYELDGHGHTGLIPVDGTTTDLETLAAIVRIAVSVSKGDLSPMCGRVRIEALAASPPRFGLPLQVAAGGLASVSIALLLGASAADLIAVAPIGLAVALFCRLGQRSQRLHNTLELGAAALATLLTLAAGHLLSLDLRTVILAGIVQLLPGLTVTTGVAELTSGNLVSGTARLAGALMTLLNLAIGVALIWTIGARLAFMPSFGGDRGSAATTIALAIVGMAIAFSISQNARLRDIGVVLAAVVVATLASRLGAWTVGPTLGLGLGSLAVGLLANAYSRYLHHPKSTVSLPGLTALVPGALGFRGVLQLASNGGSNGVNVIVAMLLLAAALVVGFSIAEAIVPPRTVRERVLTEAADDIPLRRRRWQRSVRRAELHHRKAASSPRLGQQPAPLTSGRRTRRPAGNDEDKRTEEHARATVRLP